MRRSKTTGPGGWGRSTFESRGAAAPRSRGCWRLSAFPAAERRHFASHQRELVGENLRAQSAGGTADLSSLRDFTLARSESHQLTLVASEMSPLRG